MSSTSWLFMCCFVVGFSGYVTAENGAEDPLMAAAWSAVMSEPAGEECYPGADIGIIADRSSSIKLPHFKTLKIDLAKMVDRFHITPNGSRVGIILFGRSVDVWLNFTAAEYYSNNAVKRRIQAIPDQLQYHTRTDKALQAANEYLFGDISLGDRPERRNYLFVLTDGRPFPEHLVAPFNETVPPLEDKGVEIIAVGIGREMNKNEEVLKEIAGKNGHVVLVNDYDALAARVNEIVSKACNEDGGYSEWEDWSDCSVTCGGGVQRRTRRCTNPPPKGTGKTCEEQIEELGPAEETRDCNTWQCDNEVCEPGADIGIIADRSKSIKKKHFRILKADLAKLVDEFIISPNHSRMGLVLYNRHAELVFGLEDTRYYSNEAVKERIAKIPVKLKYYTRIDKALEMANRKFFGDESLGDRPDRANYLFVFTDGRPFPVKKVKSFDKTIPPLEAKGVTIISVGIGREFNIRDDILYQIAGQNGEVIKVESFSQLAQKIHRIASSACDRDGGYSYWGRWSVCSVTCGGGIRSRSRPCTNPPPRGFGKNCDHLGPATETEPCNAHECDRDGNFTEWSDWPECPVTCGGATIRRSRTCTSPPPAGGGKNCDDLGPAEETRECNVYQCIEACPNAQDIAVAMEYSVRVTSANFATMKTFVQGLVYSFGVSADATHFATLLFARTTDVYFDFTESAYYDPVAIKQKIGGIPDELRFGRNTDKVFSKANKALFTAETGDREGTPNAMLILTSGDPGGSQEKFDEVLAPLEAKGVRIVAVGIGDEVGPDALKMIAGANGDTISIPDFDTLHDYLEQVRDSLCGS